MDAASCVTVSLRLSLILSPSLPLPLPLPLPLTLPFTLTFTLTLPLTKVRSFLSPFRLPGEAQKIDRIMCEFSQRYCTQNPGVFADPDAAYVLGFSVSTCSPH